MTSAVDSTFPADAVKVSKATMRAQQLIIKNEITALQQRIALPGRTAFEENVTTQEVQRLILLNRKAVYSRDLAFGRVAL